MSLKTDTNYKQLDVATADDGNVISPLHLVLVGSALLFCCLVSTIPAASIASIIIAIGHLTYQGYKNPLLIMKYTSLVFGVAANVLGCLSSEFSGAYLPELEVFSRFAGSLPLLILIQWIFIQALFLFDNRFSCKFANGCMSTEGIANWVQYLTFGIMIATMVLFASVVSHPSFLIGYDRFKYAAEYISGPRATVASWMSFLIIIPIIAIRQNKSKFGAIAVFFYLLYLLWTGNKFGSFMGLLWAFALVYCDAIAEAGIKRMRRVLLGGIVAMFALVFLATGIMAVTSKADPVERLSERIAEQGQLWWTVYSLYENDPHPEAFQIEIDAIVNQRIAIRDNVGSMNGIYGMMYLSAPAAKVSTKLMGGSRYTEAGYAATYYYFGPIGCIAFAILNALIFSLLVNMLIGAIRGLKMIEVAVCWRMTLIGHTAFSMFTPVLFFTPASIACIAYLFLKEIPTLLSSNSAKQHLFSPPSIAHKGTKRHYPLKAYRRR